MLAFQNYLPNLTSANNSAANKDREESKNKKRNCILGYVVATTYVSPRGYPPIECDQLQSA